MTRKMSPQMRTDQGIGSMTIVLTPERARWLIGMIEVAFNEGMAAPAGELPAITSNEQDALTVELAGIAGMSTSELWWLG